MSLWYSQCSHAYVCKYFHNLFYLCAFIFFEKSILYNQCSHKYFFLCRVLYWFYFYSIFTAVFIYVFSLRQCSLLVLYTIYVFSFEISRLHLSVLHKYSHCIDKIKFNAKKVDINNWISSFKCPSILNINFKLQHSTFKL